MKLKESFFVLIALMSHSATAAIQPLELDFNDGVDSWRVVLDGVMGGRSSGRIVDSEPGLLVFNGNLSLENNGGFSQIRTNINEGSLTNQEGLEIRFLGDGRTYQFDIRVSNVRLMAGGFQTNFDTKKGEWQTVQLPFKDFQLYSFNRKVPNPPVLDPAKIESIGITLADKNSGAFKIKIDSIRSYDSKTTEEASSSPRPERSLTAVAESAGLNTLLNLFSRSGIELLEGEKVTIFAPSESAFSKLPPKTIEYLQSEDGKSTLQSILKYHITSGEIRSNQLFNKRSLNTLNGQDVKVNVNNGLSISDAGFEKVDIEFDRGIVHVIDSVLIPESNSILELATQTKNLSTLVAAINTAGIADQLGPKNGPWTVFAPINSAFSALPDGTVEELLKSQNRTQLIDLLGLHVVPGRISNSELLDKKYARTYFGHRVQFSIKNGQLLVDDAKIIQADIQASNGIIHFIDSVITPKKSETASTVDINTNAAPQLNQSAVRIYELAIRRGVPLFNEGQQDACAFIYELAIESMITLGSDSLDPRGIERLKMGLAEAESENDWAERAWIYRRALDEANERFQTYER